MVIAVAAGCDSAPSGPADPAAAPDLAALLGAGAEDGYVRARSSRTFRFPADHAAHDGFRNEWWYLTGNLDAANGRRFGYELTLFRFRLTPDGDAGAGGHWSTPVVQFAHLALTDVAAGRFHYAERASRAAAGLAGVADEPLRIWLYDWSVTRETDGPGPPVWRLVASDDDIGIALSLVAERAPVLHGDGGRSQKSAEPGNASYYYSIPRLATSGSVRVGTQQYDVNGLSWLDREWSSSALGRDQQGWDWFALQLADGSNLMYYRLRQKDGGVDPHSGGTFMPAGLPPVPLAAGDVRVEPLRYWRSSDGVRYPVAWRLEVPAAGLDLEVQPLLDDQELVTLVRYWEGAVNVDGMRGPDAVSGRGYVELTGYAGDGGTGR